MGEGKQELVTQLQDKYKKLESGFKDILGWQTVFAREAAIVTATSSIKGAAIRGLWAFSGGPLIQARNFVVMMGVNACISCVMKRLRGKADVQSSALRDVKNPRGPRLIILDRIQREAELNKEKGGRRT